MTLGNLKNRLNKFEAKRSVYKEQGLAVQKQLKEQKQKQQYIEEALKFLQYMAKKTQQTIEQRLASLVTSALQTVYPEENYEFKIKFVEKRNSTECQLLFVKDNQEYRPLEESAGGVIDIASLALLVAFIKLEKKRPVIFTDEPFRFVSRQKIDITSQLFKNICDKLGFQIITVTHLKELIQYADQSFYIYKGEVQ